MKYENMLRKSKKEHSDCFINSSRGREKFEEKNWLIKIKKVAYFLDEKQIFKWKASWKKFFLINFLKVDLLKEVIQRELSDITSVKLGFEGQREKLLHMFIYEVQVTALFCARYNKKLKLFPLKIFSICFKINVRVGFLISFYKIICVQKGVALFPVLETDWCHGSIFKHSIGF